MALIQLTDVHLRYPVYTTSRQRSILGLAANRASFGHIARDAGKVTVVDALNGISLELRDGDRLALIGRNGSGKTSLLKVCAGLMTPDQGSMVVRGTRASILHPASGLDPEKSGLDNIDMIGRLMGMRRGQRKLLVDDVAEFTELGGFLSLPVRTYSSGMTVRLAFALATSVDRDIVVVDEVIGAGDVIFMEKAARRVRSLFERAKILVLATHAAEIASRLCNRAAWIDGGKLAALGAPEQIWDAYVHQRLPHLEGSVAAA